MKQIERGLHQLHATARENASRDEPMEAERSGSSQQKKKLPFVKVERVDAGSPAANAVRHLLFLFLSSTPYLYACVSIPQGLTVGDEIIRFGSISSENFQNMQNIATVVQHSKGVSKQSIPGYSTSVL